MRLSVQIEFDKILDLETHKNSVTVGRGKNSDLIIAHDSISRTHCQIDCVRGAFFITDLGSSNGTFIDGVRLEPQVKTPLQASQQLTLSKLDCEVSNQYVEPVEEPKIISSTVSASGDFTATLRISRLDLSRPVPHIEHTHRSKSKNPILDGLKRTSKRESKKAQDLMILLIVILSLAAAWYLAPN